MQITDKILQFNRSFVAAGSAEAFAATPKIPRLQTAIVTCMDTRLLRLLPAALGIDGGDVKMIRNAGGLVTDPWDSAMRSILVAIYELGVTNVMIIAHTDCGVEGMDGRHMLHLARERGISREAIDTLSHAGIDLEGWLTGFTDTRAAVIESVDLVRNHPLMPQGVAVSGYIFDTVTGRLDPLTSEN